MPSIRIVNIKGSPKNKTQHHPAGGGTFHRSIFKLQGIVCSRCNNGIQTIDGILLKLCILLHLFPGWNLPGIDYLQNLLPG